MKRLTWLMVLYSGALKVTEIAHLQEELVKNNRACNKLKRLEAFVRAIFRMMIV